MGTRLGRLSLRARLLALVVTSILPLFSFAIVWQYIEYREAIASTGERTLALARSLVLGLDEVLDKHIAIVEVLARSPALEAGDLTGVRARLDDLLAHRMPGANFLVLRPDGQQRLNTSVAPGVPLPRRQYMEVTRRAVATRRPAVSDIFPGAVTGKPVLAIDVPVVAANGDVVSVLSLNPPVSVFSELIHHQGLPAGWFVVVYDRQGVIVA
ncbi:MAG TPA: cache domain-containing protein, partial [Candidatus Sulfotelmatobacter sp.]|nr:cache domain-containing protein [Candidatus Sulfotelmatobacter sp.]